MNRVALSIFLIFAVLGPVLRVSVLDDAYRLSQEQAELSAREDALRSPGLTVLQFASFEHPLAMADLTWLQIVQQLGHMRISAESWGRIRRWSDIATDLDPLYFVVYHAVAVNLSAHGRLVDLADEVLLRAWDRLPDRFEFPMLLAYNAYWVRGDALLGADYLAAASKLPRAPRFLAALSGRMRYHGGDEEGAIEMLEMFLTELDGDARAEAEERLLILRSQALMRTYDEACRQYRDLHGVRPTPALLFESGLVEAPPRDLLGNEIELDASCVARTELIQVREFEAQERVGQVGRREFEGFDIKVKEKSE